MGHSGKFIECRKIQLTLLSASGLENVRTMFKMKVYARVSIGGIKKTKKRTPVDKHGKENPAWSHMLSYTMADAGVRHPGLMFVIKLYCKRKLGDRYIGEVHASIKELFDLASSDGGSATMCFPVQKGSAKSNGELKFSCKFGEKIQVPKPPVWKRVVQSGVSIILRVAFISYTGIDMPIQVPLFADPDIVDGDDDAS